LFFSTSSQTTRQCKHDQFAVKSQTRTAWSRFLVSFKAVLADLGCKFLQPRNPTVVSCLVSWLYVFWAVWQKCGLFSMAVPPVYFAQCRASMIQSLVDRIDPTCLSDTGVIDCSVPVFFKSRWSTSHVQVKGEARQTDCSLRSRVSSSSTLFSVPGKRQFL